MTTIAFLGLGNMGAPIARNLVAAGFSVHVWNRTAAATQSIAGATPHPTPTSAAKHAELVITMLADDTAVEQVVLGPDGAATTLPAGALHIGMSTISVKLAALLDERHRAAGQRYVAAPVFGRPDAAAARKLWIIPGGDPADLERAKPVFDAVGQGVFVMGTAVQATLAKLIGNFLIAGTVELFGEGLVLAEKAGLAPEKMLEMLMGTSFGSPVAQRYGDRLVKTEFLPAGFTVLLGLKDLNLALDAAGAHRVPLPLANLVRDRLLTTLAEGRGHYDWSGFATAIRESAGLPATRPAEGRS